MGLSWGYATLHNWCWFDYGRWLQFSTPLTLWRVTGEILFYTLSLDKFTVNPFISYIRLLILKCVRSCVCFYSAWQSRFSFKVSELLFRSIKTSMCLEVSTCRLEIKLVSEKEPHTHARNLWHVELSITPECNVIKFNLAFPKPPHFLWHSKFIYKL